MPTGHRLRPFLAIDWLMDRYTRAGRMECDEQSYKKARHKDELLRCIEREQDQILGVIPIL